MTTNKQQLIKFLAQNDNDMLDEEAEETLWVSMQVDCNVPDDVVVELENADRVVVSRFQLTLTEL